MRMDALLQKRWNTVVSWINLAKDFSPDSKEQKNSLMFADCAAVYVTDRLRQLQNARIAYLAKKFRKLQRELNSTQREMFLCLEEDSDLTLNYETTNRLYDKHREILRTETRF